MIDKTVLVVGGGGFIGRTLAEKLALNGHHVIAATRQPHSYSHAGIENVVATYDSVEHFLPLLARSGAVVHAASISTPGSSDARPQLEGNLNSTLALLEALQVYNDRRLVYLSSGGTLYGERVQPATECDPIGPRSYHGAGKVAAEAFIHAWAMQYAGTAIVLRPSNVYGPGQFPRPGFGVISAAFACVQAGRSLEIWGGGETMRDYLFIDDLIRLCVCALTHDFEAGHRIFNAASGRCISLNDLLQLIDVLTGHQIARVHKSFRRVDVHSIALDPTAASLEFGWQAKVGLEEGLLSTWAWFQTRQ